MEAAGRGDRASEAGVCRCVCYEHGACIHLCTSPRGERAYGKAPRNYGKNLTLIASISTTGMGEAMTLEGAAAGGAFEAYVESLLCPSLVCR